MESLTAIFDDQVSFDKDFWSNMYFKIAKENCNRWSIFKNLKNDLNRICNHDF